MSARREPRPIALLGAFLACALIWGSTFLVISVGNEVVPAFWGAALRLGIASALLVVIALATRHPLPRGAAFRAAIGYGFFNMGLSFCLLYWAEKRVASGLAAVFYATVPLSTTFLTRAFGLERITWAKVGAAGIALAGVAVIFSGQIGDRAPVGPLFALLAAAMFAPLSTVILKHGPRQNPIGANAVGAGVGCLVCLVVSLVAREPHFIPTRPDQLFPILYLSIAGSIGAFVAMAWLVNYWDVTRISLIAVIVPVVAVVLGCVFRGERFGVASLIGSLLVLGGVLLRIRGDRRGSTPATLRAPESTGT
jgi:drug/metabolite transporter (DMT)-like permease